MVGGPVTDLGEMSVPFVIFTTAHNAVRVQTDFFGGKTGNMNFE